MSGYLPYAMLPGHIMSGYAIASKIETFMGSVRSEGLKEIIVLCLSISEFFRILNYFRAMKGDYLAPTIPIFQHLQKGSNETFSECRYIPLKLGQGNIGCFLKASCSIHERYFLLHSGINNPVCYQLSKANFNIINIQMNFSTLPVDNEQK